MDEVEQLLLSPDISKTTGPGIMLRFTTHSIALSVTNLANIIPIPKEGDLSDFKNYM